MGQEDIVKILEIEYRKDPDKFLSRKEIAERLGKNPGKYGCSFLNKPLRRLRKNDEIEYKKSNPHGGYIYRFKVFDSKIIRRN